MHRLKHVSSDEGWRAVCISTAALPAPNIPPVDCTPHGIPTPTHNNANTRIDSFNAS